MEERVLTREGLNTFLGKVFLWMFIGLLITGVVSYYVSTSSQILTFVFSNMGVFFALIIGEFILVGIISKNVMKYSFSTTVALFLLYSALNGITLSAVFIVYTGSTLFVAFGATALIFGVMSLYGHFTKTDLTPFVGFFMVGIIGIIILSIINIFIASSSMSYWIGIGGVVIFAGLTAYDLQKMKNIYYYSLQHNEDIQGNLAINGALSIYLDFINLFLFILRILGRKK